MKSTNQDSKKNFSFYMPKDFDEKLEKVIQNNDFLKTLSKSQAIYYIISKVASLHIDLR